MTRAEILRRAVQTAIARGCQRKTISVPAWAQTYGVTQKQVRETWEFELTKETNSNVSEGK
jgi:hypothetical protein